MNRNLKVFLIVGAVVVGLLGLVIVGSITIIYLNKDKFLAGAKNSMEDGMRFGKDVDQTACLEEGLRRSEGKGPFGAIGPGLFLSGCLRAAEEVEGFCEGVPPAGEIMATVAWSQERCVEVGQPGDQACTQLMQ